MTTLNAFDRILASLHRAALDDAHWLPTAALIEEAAGVAGNVLVAGEGLGDNERIHFARYHHRGQPRQDLVREYLDVHYPHDTGARRLMGLPDARLVHIPDLYTEDERKRSPVYNEFLPRVGLHKGLYARFDEPDGLRMVWGVSNPTAGGWQADRLALIERLRPHIRHFVLVRQALEGAEAVAGGLASLLENRRIGVLYLDRRGRLLAANAPALSVLRRGDMLFDQGGTLHARRPAEDDRLQGLLGRALPQFGPAPPAGGSMTLRHSLRGAWLGLRVTPVGDADAHSGDRRVAALALLVDPANRPRIDPQWVAEALGLTPSEARVAALLAEGRSVRDIAASAGHRESYVRSQLRDIYKKLGLPGQVALVRAVLGLNVLSGS